MGKSIIHKKIGQIVDKIMVSIFKYPLYIQSVNFFYAVDSIYGYIYVFSCFLCVEGNNENKKKKRMEMMWILVKYG